MEKEYKLLIINPGSTSTKISLFINEKEQYERSQFHVATNPLWIDAPSAFPSVR